MSSLAQRGFSAGNGQQRGLNNALSVGLLLVVALAPVPLGSARALFWGMSAVAVGAIAVVYCLLMLSSRNRLRIGISSIWPQTVLFLAMIAALVLQILPLGGVFGPFAVTGQAGTFYIDTLSISPGMTNLMLVRQLSYGAFFLLFLQCAANDDRRARALDAIIVICAAYGFIGLVSLQANDVILGFTKWAYQGMATGTFVNRNSFATFLALGACVSAAKFAGSLVPQRQTGRFEARISVSGALLYGIALGVMGLVVLATQSRMGLFVTFAGSTTAILAVLIGARDWRAMLSGLIVLIGAVIALLFQYGSELLDRFISTDQAAISRTDLYQQVLELIRLRPWFGFGGGSFELAFPLVHHAPVSPDYTWDRAHDTYLALAAELGVVFGALPVLIFVVSAVGLLFGIARSQTTETRVSLAAGLGALVAAGIHSLVDFSLEIQGVTYLFLAICACATAAAIRSRQRAAV